MVQEPVIRQQLQQKKGNSLSCNVKSIGSGIIYQDQCRQTLSLNNTQQVNRLQPSYQMSMCAY